MTTLERALTLAERPHTAVRVGEDLELDVLRSLDELLHEDVGVLEAGLRLARRLHEVGFDLGLGADDAHAAPAATAARLEDDRKPDALRLGESVRRVFQDLRAGKEGKSIFAGVRARRDLVTPRAHRLGGGPDEGDVALRAHPRELRILGEEAVPRMNRIGAGDLGGGDDGWNMQVTARGRRGADAHRFVGEANVQRAGVGLGVHGDGRDAELAARADDAQRDLAAIRDEDLLEGRMGRARSGRPAPHGRRRCVVHAFLMRKSF